MGIRPIRLYPDPVLRQRCRPVESFDEELRALVDDLIETMRAAPGVGLAAPQVGIDLRVAVVDPSAGRDRSAVRVLVNPAVELGPGRETDVEGCLSLPELSERVTRPSSCRVAALDAAGSPTCFDAEGYLARIVLHEVDHLDGVLFVDHLRGLKRERAKRHLKRLAREAASLGAVP